MIDTLEALAAALLKYADDCADARTWGGPTIYPEHPLSEAGCRKAAKLIQDKLAAPAEPILLTTEIADRIGALADKLKPVERRVWDDASCGFVWRAKAPGEIVLTHAEAAGLLTACTAAQAARERLAQLADERAERMGELFHQLGALRTERDEARAIVAQCNNSLFGSESYFTDANGRTAAQAIEELKERANVQWLRAELAYAALTTARTELFGLCEAIADDAANRLQVGDLEEIEKGFARGQKVEAKAIARAMGEVFRDLIQQNKDRSPAEPRLAELEQEVARGRAALAYIQEHEPRCYADTGGFARSTAFMEVRSILQPPVTA